MAANRSGASAASVGDVGSLSTASAASIVFLSAPLARPAACSSSTTPSDSSPARSSWAAAILRCSSSRQVAKTSLQASIVHCQRPITSTGNSPSQRTPLTCASIGRIGDSTQRRLPGPR